MSTETLAALAVALAAAWGSGLNVYATVLVLGTAERLGLVSLPHDLQVLGSPWVLGVAAILFALNFLADKIPAVDSVWDAVHTFIRVPAGAVLAAAAFADFPPSVRIAALLVGGGVALSAHGSKAATRVAVNTMSVPGANVVVSAAEDVLAIGSSVLMVFHPLVVLCLVLAALAVTVCVLPRIVRTVWRRARPARPRREAPRLDGS